MSFLNSIGIVSAYFGAFIIFYSLWPLESRFRARIRRWYHGENIRQITQQLMGELTVVVPARNEEKNLPKLLESFRKFEFKPSQIIVVDDRSIDRTAEIAQSYGALLVDGTEKPHEWKSPKSWACYRGSEKATGKYLLFTDADTEHFEMCLVETIQWMKEKNYSLVSALWFHHTEKFWEKLLGPFYLLLLIATHALRTPKIGRYYANGQFLLFESRYYQTSGHAQVKSELAEDLALARLALDRGMGYGVRTLTPTYKVRMYPGLKEFVSGWRRNFQLGIKSFSIISVVELILVFVCLLGPFVGASFWTWPAFIFAWLFLFFQQDRYGEFSFMGVVLMPISLFLFFIITLLSLLDRYKSKSISWKGQRLSS